MKKWCKLSLASLIIPTAGGVTLVAVGCGAANIDVYVPQLDSGINLIGGTDTDPVAWWNQFTTPEARLNALNNYLTKDTQLSTVEAQDASVKGFANNTKIQFTVKLNENYQFLNDNGSSQWTSPEIDYQGPIDINTFFKPIDNIYGNAKTLSEWSSTISQSSDPKVLIPNLFVTYPNLDTISKVSINPAATNQLVNATGTQNFNVTIELKKDKKNAFVFSNQTSTYTTPISKPMVYHGGTMTSLTNPQLNISTEIKEAPISPAEWFNSLGETPMEKFKNIFKQDTEISQDKLVDVYLVQTQPFSNTFSIGVVLQNAYFNSTNTNTITFNGFTYTSTSVPTTVTKPELINPSVNVLSSADNVDAWWKKLNDTTEQINAINSWFKPSSDLNAIAGAISSISLVPNQQDQSKWDLTINLTDGKTFSDHKNFVSFTINITYTQSNVPLPTPALQTGTIKQNGDQKTLKEWWDSFNQDLTKEVNALNPWFDAGKDLSSIKIDYIGSITLDIGSQNPAKVTLMIKLKSPYVFDTNKSDTLTLNGTVEYSKKAQKIGLQPTIVSSKSLSVTTSITDVNTWWKSFNNVVNNQVEAIKSLFNNDALTKIKANIASITLNPNTDKTKWDLTITLNSGSIFNDGSKSAEYKGITITLQPILVTDPKLVNSTIVETGTEQNASAWVNAFNGWPKPTKITYLNEKVFDQNTNLNSFKDHIDKIEFVGTSDKTKYNLTITLIPGYHFSSNHADKLTLPITINFTHQDFVTKPELKPGASATVATTAPSIKQWWSDFKSNLELEIPAINDWFQTGKDLISIKQSIKSLELNQQGSSDKWDLNIKLNDNTFFANSKESTTTLTITLTFVSQKTVTRPTLKLGASATVATTAPSIKQWWSDFKSNLELEIPAINDWFQTGKDLISIKQSIKSLALNQQGSSDKWDLNIKLNDNVFFTDSTDTSEKLTINLKFVHQTEVKEPIINTEPKAIDAKASDVKAWWDSLGDKNAKIATINQWFQVGSDLNSIKDSIKSLDLNGSGANWKLTIQLVDNSYFSIAKDESSVTLSVTINYRMIVTDPKLINFTIVETGTEQNASAWVKAFNARPNQDKITYLNEKVFDQNINLNSFKDHIDKIEFVGTSDKTKYDLTITLSSGYCFASNHTDKITLSPITINFTHQDFVTRPELKPGASATVGSTATSIKQWWSDFKNNLGEEINEINGWFETGKDLSSIKSNIKSLELNQQGSSDKWDLKISLNDNTFFTNPKESSTTLTITLTFVHQIEVKTPELKDGVSTDVTVATTADNVKQWWDNFNNNTEAEIKAINGWFRGGSDLNSISSSIASLDLQSLGNDNYNIIIKLKPNTFFAGTGKKDTATLSIIIEYKQQIKVDTPILKSTIDVNSTQPTIEKWVSVFNQNSNEEIARIQQWLQNASIWDTLKNQILFVQLMQDPNKANHYILGIMLKDNYVFDDGTGKLTNQIKLPINKINYNVLLDNPTLKKQIIDITSKQTLPDWINSFNNTAIDNQTKLTQIGIWLNNFDIIKGHIDTVKFANNSDNNTLVIKLLHGYLFTNQGAITDTVSLKVNINFTHQTFVTKPSLKDGVKIIASDKFNNVDAWWKSFKNNTEKIDAISGWFTGSDLKNIENNISTLELTGSGNNWTLKIQLANNTFFMNTTDTSATFSVMINFHVIVKDPEFKTNDITVNSNEASLSDWLDNFTNLGKQDKIAKINQWLKPDANLDTLSDKISSIELISTNGNNCTLTIKLNGNYVFSNGQPEKTWSIAISYNVLVDNPSLNTPNISINGDGDLSAWIKQFNDSSVDAKFEQVNNWFQAGTNLSGLKGHIGSIRFTGSGANNTLEIVLKDNYLFADNSQKTASYQVQITFTQNPIKVDHDPEFNSEAITINSSQPALNDWVNDFNVKSADQNLTTVNKWLKPNANLNSFSQFIDTMILSSNGSKYNLTIKLKGNHIFNTTGNDSITLSITINYNVLVKNPKLISQTINISSPGVLADWIKQFNDSGVNTKFNQVNGWFQAGANLSPFEGHIDSIKFNTAVSDNNLVIVLKDNYLFADNSQKTATISATINYSSIVKAPVMKKDITQNGSEPSLALWWDSYKDKGILEKATAIEPWFDPTSWTAIKNDIGSIELVTTGENEATQVTLTISLKTGFTFGNDTKVILTGTVKYIRQVSINIPKMAPNDQLAITAIDNIKTAKDWFDAKFTTASTEEKLNIFNTWLSEPLKGITANQLTFTFVAFQISGRKFNNAFNVTINLTIPGYHFGSDINQTSWTTTSTITYGITNVNIPRTQSFRASIKGPEANAHEWWINQFEKLSSDQKLDMINSWSSNVMLIPPDKVTYEFVPVDTNPDQFKVKITLTKGYTFVLQGDTKSQGSTTTIGTNDPFTFVRS